MIKYKWPIKYNIFFENGKLVRADSFDGSFKNYIQKGNIVTAVKYPENKKDMTYSA